MSQVQAASPTSAIGQEQRSQPATAVGSLPNSHQNNAASSPLPMSTSNSSIGNTMSSSGSVSSLSSTLASSNTSISSFLAMASPEERSKFPPQVLAELAQYMGAQGNGKNSPETVSAQQENNVNGQDYGIPEESWKHHVQARAILGNLMGPNGEQLTSTDPYNTTVFVGGLSPLIGEDTLRSFFAPFGEIHYVSKVPYSIPSTEFILSNRSKYRLENTAVLCNLFVKQMPNVLSQRCKVTRLEVARYVSVGVEANVSLRNAFYIESF